MKDKRNYLIAGLLVAVLFMGIGFAALTQQLTINGTAKISSTWDVKITGISDGVTTGLATVGEHTYTSTSATFDVDFKKPGDSATFDITVTNSGSLNAKLKNVDIQPSTATSGTNGIKYTVTGATVGTALNASGTNKITVKAEWVGTDTSMPAEKTKTITVTLDYEQV